MTRSIMRVISHIFLLILTCQTGNSSLLYSTFLSGRSFLPVTQFPQSFSLQPAQTPPPGSFSQKYQKYRRHESLLKLRGGLVPYYNLGVSSLILAETVLWLKIWTELAKREILPSTLTRKIIHSGSAPLFILHWPLFSQDSSDLSRLFASAIPLLQIGRLLYAGLVSSDEIQAVDGVSTHAKNDLVAAVSRTGKKSEALGGPLIYSIVLFLGTFFFFRDSPVGIVAICQMAAGDGLADIIGRRYGKVKWPFSERKSIAGSLAFFLGGFLCSFLALWWMNFNHFLPLDPSKAVIPLLAISLLCAVIELFPIVDDNISVPLVAAGLSWWWLQ